MKNISIFKNYFDVIIRSSKPYKIKIINQKFFSKKKEPDCISGNDVYGSIIESFFECFEFSFFKY